MLRVPDLCPYIFHLLRIQGTRTFIEDINIAWSALHNISDIINSTSPGLNQQLNKIVRGSLVQAELNAQREEEIELQSTNQLTPEEARHPSDSVRDT